MTTSKKPSTGTTARKTTTKRGPTKAAALKALGITSEELEVIKSLREGVEAAKSFDGEKAEVSAIEAAPEPREPIFYMRNLRGMDLGFRLESQEGQGKKRTDLKPRGERGDMKKISKEDLHDANLATQVSFGLVEIITEYEALQIIEKQNTNISRAPSVVSQLRNEKDEAYPEGAVIVEPSFEDQGIVVAHLNPQGGGAGEIPGQGRGGIDWQQARSGVQQNVPAGGNPAIISDGFAADAIARQKGLEGPAAGLGGVKVTVAPTEKVE